METSIQTYVNPLSDAGFKALLCDPANKPVLIGMLNAFLPPDRMVEDLEYATTEIPGLTLAGKASRVDLRCTDTLGRSFIVEVQRSPQPNFFRRCVYYASRIYALGARRGDGQRYDILPVYLVALLDRGFGFRRDPSEWEGRYVSRYTFREKETGQVEDETISIIFVELDRFGKEEFGECAGAAEEWCWMLKNMWRLHPSAEELREVYCRFEGVLGAGEIAGFSKEKRAKYDADMITERDYYNILETAKQEGEAKGEEKGRQEAALQIAKNMLASGMPKDQVISMTGLTAEQLAGLK